jgi:hypothetical protein
VPLTLVLQLRTMVKLALKLMLESALKLTFGLHRQVGAALS